MTQGNVFVFLFWELELLNHVNLLPSPKKIHFKNKKYRIIETETKGMFTKGEE